MSHSRIVRVDAAADLLETLRETGSRADCTPELRERLGRLVTSVFVAGAPLEDRQWTEILRALCELATSEYAPLRELGQEVVFSDLVERLSDSFSPEGVERYNQVFARLIAFCRRLPGAGALDAQLGRFGIRDEQDLLARRARLRGAGVFRQSRAGGIKKVFVLSRVTLGAEVAITSLILQKIRRTLPHAEPLLVAPEQVTALFGGDDELTVVATPYPRHGGLLNRLESWVDLIRTLDGERRGLGPAELLVIDPDSRATQLGLLPVTEHDAGYYFFESRSFQRPGLERIGELTVAWLDEVFGADDRPLYPRVSLRPRDLDLGRTLARRFLSGPESHVVSMNLGVGGNPRKRVGDEFEIELVRRILDEGSQLVLDKGVGEEREQANRILAALRADGNKVIEVTETGLGAVQVTGPALAAASDGATDRCDVLAWEGGVGAFSALVATTGLYVGYDSAFQHVAAALGIPVIDIFVDSRGPVFMCRWQPYSRAAVRTVPLDPVFATGSQSSLEQALALVLDAYRELRHRRPVVGDARDVCLPP